MADNEGLPPNEQQQTAAAPSAQAEVGQPAPVVQQQSLVNVIDPDTQQLGAIPHSQLQDALNQGFTVAHPEEVNKYFKEQEFGTGKQQAIAGLEGAAKGLTFGASAPLEVAAGLTTPERIEAREEVNPGTSTAGMIGGLGLSSLIPGVGEANLLTKAGEAGAAAVGLAAPVSTAAKIGSQAVKFGIENMLIEGGDEAAKLSMMEERSPEAVQSAVVNTGLAGLLGGVAGGAFGSVSPLWQAASGSKMGGILKALSEKAGGIEGVTTDSMTDAIAKSGMKLEPEMQAALSSDPAIQNMFQTLNQSDTTKSGRALQESFQNFRDQAHEALASSLGKNINEIPQEVSRYENGRQLSQILAKEYQEQLSPIVKEFDALKSKYGNTELISDSSMPNITNEGLTYEKVPGTVNQIADKVVQLASDQGWLASPSSDIMSEINRVLKELPAQKTINDLSNYIKAIGSNMQSDPMNGPMRRAGGMIKGILKEAEADVIADKIGDKEGAQALQRFKDARTQYAAQSEIKEALDSRLHAGGSTSGFSKSLREMGQTDGEKFFQRLSGTRDADLLQTLQQNFPRTAEALKQNHLDDLLKSAVDKAGAGQSLNATSLVKSVDKLSPEMRDFLLDKNNQDKIQAVSQLLEHFNAMPHNYSNTARTMDKLLGHIPGSALGVAAAVHGANPIVAALMSPIVKILGKDIPDAARLATLKFLGSAKPIEASGFKAMADMIHATSEGQNLIARATKNVLKADAEVLPDRFIPKEKDRDKLDKVLKELSNDPKAMEEVGGDIGHYMPEHNQALGQTAARAVSYLNGKRPDTAPKNPLDAKIVPSKAESSAFNRTLDIAQQPLMVLKYMKEGTLQPQDVAAIQNLYPDLYNKLSAKLVKNIIDAKADGQSISPKMRMQASMFTGQPLDSSMTPMGISNAQMTFQTPPSASNGNSQSQSKGRPAQMKDSKLPQAAMTPSQASQARKLKD